MPGLKQAEIRISEQEYKNRFATECNVLCLGETRGSKMSKAKTSNRSTHFDKVARGG